MLTYHFSRQRALRTKEVQFGLLSAEQTRKMATVKVSNPNIMHRGTPQSGAVNDLMMGSIDRRLRCSTCGGDVRTCQGHTGVIELGAPVYSIGFIDPTLKCLRSVCFFCSRLLVTEQEATGIANDELSGKQLFLAVYQVARTRKRCMHCHGPQPSYQRVVNSIKLEWPTECQECFEDDAEHADVTSRVFTSIEAHSILTNISDEDCALMGFKTSFSHPRDMVQDVCHVIPPIARPAIMQSTGSRIRGQDDITHCLQSILKRSIDLKSSMKAVDWDHTKTPSNEIVERLGKLQNEVFAMVNNSVRGNRQAVQRSGAPFKSLVCRIRGKEGRIRGNLNGKRVDFSARSVISPDPVMSVDEVGVPEAIALELTIQERVTHANRNELRQRVLAGGGRLDGAQAIIDRDGTVTQLAYCEDLSKIVVEPGMVVERYMKNGDLVVFNRQPSLHKFSIMAHRAKIMPGSTLRLNLSCTTAYNADFDGDEMNLHLLQSPLAIEEARGLMSVANNVMSPQSNRPVIAIVQDTLLGASLLTESTCLLTRKQYMRYACWIRRPVTPEKARVPPPAILYPEPLWTGTQLFSALVPPAITMWKGKKRTDWPTEGDVYIRRGVLLHGRATKAILGPATGGLIDCIARDAGARAIITFESDIQRVISQFLLQRGFSVKMSDCVLSEEGDREVRELVKMATQNARAIVDAPLPETMRVSGESVVQNCLSKLLMQTGSIAKKHMRADNAIATMVHVGSKGSAINLCQIAGTVAQQTVEGRRIFAESSDRTLPCYKNGDKSLESNGFVASNYQRGLTPQEFFFHAMGGREGLVDTAVKTACTGYIQRRQVKMTEDHHVSYDGTVRTAQDLILEYVYGGDGFDASRMERYALNSLLMKPEDIEKHFGMGLAADAATRKLLRIERALFDSHNEKARVARVSPMAPTMDPMCVLPFNPDRVLARFCEEGTTSHSAPLDAEYASIVLKCMEDICALALADAPRHCLVSALRFCFCSVVLHKLRLSPRAVVKLFELLTQYFEEAIVAAGEMVGTIAATSMGEVTTQLTLNTCAATRLEPYPPFPPTKHTHSSQRSCVPSTHFFSHPFPCAQVPHQRRWLARRHGRHPSPEGDPRRDAQDAHPLELPDAQGAVRVLARLCDALCPHAWQDDARRPRRAHRPAPRARSVRYRGGQRQDDGGDRALHHQTHSRLVPLGRPPLPVQVRVPVARRDAPRHPVAARTKAGQGGAHREQPGERARVVRSHPPGQRARHDREGLSERADHVLHARGDDGAADRLQAARQRAGVRPRGRRVGAREGGRGLEGRRACERQKTRCRHARDEPQRAGVDSVRRLGELHDQQPPRGDGDSRHRGHAARVVPRGAHDDHGGRQLRGLATYAPDRGEHDDSWLAKGDLATRHEQAGERHRASRALLVRGDQRRAHGRGALW